MKALGIVIMVVGGLWASLGIFYAVRALLTAGSDSSPAAFLAGESHSGAAVFGLSMMLQILPGLLIVGVGAIVYSVARGKARNTP